MPVRNQLFGVYKLFKINGVTYLISDSNSSRSMEAKAQNYVQGTAQTRILDIGKVEEINTVNAPILIGPASTIDGRTLLNTQILNVLDRATTTQPLLSQATVTVDADKGATVSMTLQSDGDRSVSSYYAEVSDTTVAPTELEDPSDPNRVARNWDFLVSVGPFTMFVMNAKFDFKAEIAKNVFLSDGTAAASYKFGTQYPYLGVTGFTLTGSGSAAVDITDHINDPQVVGFEDLTLQTVPRGTGYVEFASPVFSLQVSNAGTPEDLFPDIDMSKAVINKADFKVSSGLLTLDFAFTCWIFEP